ncbi:MAG: hypothetical protein HKN45_00720 [Flavobacteriales bacterium]|nr:hypothetical protein [Flavobacteriales bacterium]
MMRNLLFTFAFVTISISSFGLAIGSISDGSFEDPGIWDCTCIPGSSDDVTVRNIVTTSSGHTIRTLSISSGSRLTTAANLTVLREVTIDSGGEMRNNATMNIKKHYVLNGIHSGSEKTVFTGNADMSGTGVYSNSKMPEFFGTRDILAGSDLDFTTSAVRMKSAARMNNYGSVAFVFLWGSGSERFHNYTGASLRINQKIKAGMQLYAHYTNNIVTYFRSGTINQSIQIPVSGYYNLTLRGTSLASNKTPNNSILVLNDLRIVNCTLDMTSAGFSRDLEVHGEFNNVSGRFTPRQGTVTFGGNSTVSSFEPIEEFFDLEFSGSTALNTEISCSNEVFVSSSLDLNGFDIHVLKDWVCVGTLIGNNGIVRFDGTDDSMVSGVTDFEDVSIDKTSADVTASGTMNIYGTLSMDNGVLNTNDNVIIASNSSATGRLGEMGSATFNGDLVVQRYAQFTSNDWHLIGAAVEDMTVEEWNDDLLTTGFTGSDYPTNWFCSITKYDETVSGDKDSGVECVDSTSESIPDGEGRRVYMSAGVNQFSVKGPAITGPFSWTVTYTDTGSPDDDGWNLVANPYASTIDWDDTGNWTRTGVKDAIYVWVSEDEQFSSYIAGIGTNGGTQFIPSSQAFWIQTEAGSPTLSLLEGAKVDNDETFRNNEDISFFKVKMTTSNGKTDEAAIRLDENATFEFDSQLDAYEWRSTNTAYPSIALMTEEGKSTSIYSFPEITNETMIPMHLYVSSSGDVSFNTIGLNGFTEAQNVRLFDSLLDEYYSMGDNTETVIEIESGEYPDRFFIVINPRSSFDDIRTELASQSDFRVWTDGTNFYVQSIKDLSNSMDISIYNPLGQRVFNRPSQIIRGTAQYALPQYAGVLIIELIDNRTGERLTQRIVR